MEKEVRKKRKFETDEERHLGRLETNRKFNQKNNYAHQKAYQAKNYVPKKKKNPNEFKRTNILELFKE